VKVEILKIKGTWRDIADACNTTIGKEAGEKEPSDNWKKTILKCEHSPIRKMVYSIKLTDIPSYVSVHLVRHKHGIEHFVKSQRSDRTGIVRDELPQGALVTHEIDVNIQALITISRKRLCNMADKKTVELWNLVVDEIHKSDPILSSILVPECIYRGKVCHEFKCCGYVDSLAAAQEYTEYIK